MKKLLKIALIGACMAVVAALVAGCGSPAPAPEPEGEEIAVAFDGGMLACKGGKMIVVLDANATTGYEWKSSIEGAAVKAAGDEYEADATSDGKAGAGGVHTFTYQAEGSGEAIVTLTYARSWESSQDDRAIIVKVEVKDGAFARASVQ